mmetsp:Transcript_24503/g.46601  ORF Transcript_24503/g.46601 Transcript_24503/m.46601 type:complete len:258 (-) Transcript_24503:128-901(-)
MMFSKSVVLVVLFFTSDGFSPSSIAGFHQRVAAIRAVSIEDNVVSHGVGQLALAQELNRKPQVAVPNGMDEYESAPSQISVYPLKQELIPQEMKGEATTFGKNYPVADDELTPVHPGSNTPTNPAALALSSPEKPVTTTEAPESIVRGKDDFVPTPGQTALHPSQIYKLNLAFIPVMAEEAAAFARKKTSEPERLVATASTTAFAADKKLSSALENPKHDLTPIPSQTLPHTSQIYKPYIPVMAEEAVAFGKTKAVD